MEDDENSEVGESISYSAHPGMIGIEEVKSIAAKEVKTKVAEETKMTKEKITEIMGVIKSVDSDGNNGMDVTVLDDKDNLIFIKYKAYNSDLRHILQESREKYAQIRIVGEIDSDTTSYFGSGIIKLIEDPKKSFVNSIKKNNLPNSLEGTIEGIEKEGDKMNLVFKSNDGDVLSVTYPYVKGIVDRIVEVKKNKHDFEIILGGVTLAEAYTPDKFIYEGKGPIRIGKLEHI